MAKFKVDLSGVKQFMFQKGEKVGLLACTAIMILVVGYALFTGLTSSGAKSGKSWAAEISDGSARVKSMISSASLKDEERPKEMGSRPWPAVPSKYTFASMFPLPDPVTTKKLNPPVLSLYSAELEKSFQVDYVRGAYYAYEIDPATQKVTIIVGDKGGGGAGGVGSGGGNLGMPNVGPGGKGPAGGGGASNLAKIVRPTRMVVVSGVFPMWDQLEEFRKALRYATLEELLAHRDELPKPFGLEVSRCELLPGGKATPWKAILSFDKKNRVVIDPAIKTMMRQMVIDEENPQQAAQHIFSGLVTPLPKMANAIYAKLDLRGVEVAEVKQGEDAQKPGNKQPGAGPVVPGGNKPKPGGLEPPAQGGGAGAAGGEIQTRKEFWKKLSKDLEDKFMERYSIFEPLGVSSTSAAGKKTGPGGNLNSPPMVGSGMQQSGKDGASFQWGWDAILGGVAGGKDGPAAAAPMKDDADPEGGKANVALAVKPTDALVRFFDPDVQPGKTYVYSIRVRMENPNFGKKAEVAYQALADQKELDPWDATNNGWRFTPPITIPGDFYWYALDQTPEVKIKDGPDSGLPPFRPETAPIQVHSWMDRVTDAINGGDFPIADWAIAERLYVRRGDFVGRYRVMLELPSWRFDLQSFAIGFSAQAAKGKPKPAAKDVPIASGIPVDLITVPPSIVVDFEGGRRTNFEKRDGSKEFVTDTSAFDILVLTSDGKLVARNARSDLDTENPSGHDRSHRYDLWRDRLRELRDGPAAGGAGGGPAMPGGK